LFCIVDFGQLTSFISSLVMKLNLVIQSSSNLEFAGLYKAHATMSCCYRFEYTVKVEVVSVPCRGEENQKF
jgi:hypothetical protein